MTNYDELEYKSLLVSQRGPVLEVVLNRPEIRNAINTLFESEYEDVLAKAGADDAIRVVTVTANGPVWCSGHDLKDLAKRVNDAGGFGDFASRRLPLEWGFRKAIVAGVHGFVGPQGNHLLGPMDFVIAAKGTKFSFEQTRMGGGRSGAAILAFQIPMRALLKLYMMGGWFDEQAALEWQYVQRVVEPEDLRSEVARWADQIALIPPAQVAAAKEGVHRVYELMGLANVMTVGNRVSGHGDDKDFEFFERVEKDGLKSALKWRDAKFDSDIAKI